MKKYYYTELAEPPFLYLPAIEASEDDVITKLYYHSGHRIFIACLNLLAWQEFRWYLWTLVTQLPLLEDISLENDDTDLEYLDLPTVPYCEIQLLDDIDMTERGQRGEQNYVYTGARVDFMLTREEAYQSYKRISSMVNETGDGPGVCSLVCRNLWVQLIENMSM